MKMHRQEKEKSRNSEDTQLTNSQKQKEQIAHMAHSIDIAHLKPNMNEVVAVLDKIENNNTYNAVKGVGQTN